MRVHRRFFSPFVDLSLIRKVFLRMKKKILIETRCQSLYRDVAYLSIETLFMSL